MPPRPFSKIRHNDNGVAHFGAEAITERPEHGVLAMRVVATWGVADQVLALLVSEFLHSDFELVCGMLQALSGGESRRAAIEGAAQSALNRDDMDLFRSAMKVTRASRNRRNEFAHHNWGYLTKVEDALLLADPRYFSRYDAMRRAHKAGRRSEESLILDVSGIYVFHKRDLEEEVAAADRALDVIHDLRKAFSDDREEAARARSALSNRPDIQQALERMST